MPQPDLTKMNLEELAQLLGNVPPESERAAGYMAEFTRRQTLAQINAAEAQIRAADAAEDTANYTKNNARYLLWSVIVLALSGVGTFAVSIANVVLTTSAVFE